jgi:1,6-anhydro-N-acetylmuramate kinase
MLSPDQLKMVETLSANLARAAVTAQGAIAEAALRQADRPAALTPDPFHVAPALNEVMSRLAAHLPGRVVLPTDARGLPALQVEACAFAWLAQAHVERREGNLPSVTGAAGGRILGALYPAR